MTLNEMIAALEHDQNTNAATILVRFGADARLARANYGGDVWNLILRLVQAMHVHGVDWWITNMNQSGSIRCGRKADQGPAQAALAGIDPRMNEPLLTFNHVFGGDGNWVPLTEGAVVGIEQASSAVVANFLRKHQASREGKWPTDYPNSAATPETTLPDQIQGAHMAASNPPLNQILFGPPGTGKTYATINEALNILDPDLLLNNSGKTEDERKILKERFDEFIAEDRIRFVTFHQSFSYEDFVEGMRAVTNSENNSINYPVVPGVFKTLCKDASFVVKQFDSVSSEQGQHETTKPAIKPYVLIIDEINRGNISRIFGELITLIEPSKRAGEVEALPVVLPYSNELFSVPNNLYIIGTMNTADRSLAGLDVALRRRFTFKEMLPQPELLDDVFVGSVNVGQLLRVMNQRIEVLLDREHCLGHAYFMPLKKTDGNNLEELKLIFLNQVLPLLQEYFFEDWQRIQWVLNDHRKTAKDCFVVKGADTPIALFGEELPVQGSVWRVQKTAFDRISSYAGVIVAPTNAEGSST